jgi:ABC-type transport system substrate-binding protein
LQRKNLLKIGLSAFLVLLLTVSYFVFASPPQVQDIPDWDFPRLDEIYMVEAYPAATAIVKAKTCDIDSFIGAIRPGDVRELEDIGWTVTMNPGFHMCYLGVNCRDTAPDTAGAYFSYHGRLPGFELYPLNISNFRLALELIVGCEKDAWLAEIYEFINVRLDQCVPPANEYWFNPYIPPYPEDWDQAEALLLAAGFTWDKGADGIEHTTDDVWRMPNGKILIAGPNSGVTPRSERWAGDDYGIYVMCPGDALAPPSHEISRRHVKKWNNFFMGGVDVDTFAEGGLFQDDPQDTYDPLIDSPFCQRDHDIYFLCWGLGRNPPYLWSFFCSEADIECGDNSPGLKYDGLDRLLKSIYYWTVEDYELLDYNVGDLPGGKVLPAGREYALPYPLPPIDKVIIERCAISGVYDEVLVAGTDYEVVAGKLRLKKAFTLYSGDALEVIFTEGKHFRYITDIAEMRTMAWIAQWKLWYLVPYLPIYSRNYIDIFKGGLECWVNSRGYGAGTYQLEWTFLSIHWTGQPVGGMIKWHVGGAMRLNHPLTSRWVYDWTLLNRLYDGLLNINPYTHEDMPWAALKYEMLPWSDPDRGIDKGMAIKFWLRDDLVWADGSRVTAKDCKFSWDFLASINEPNWYDAWETYVESVVIHDYLVEVHLSKWGGLWKVYTYAGAALMFPKIIWEPFMGDWDPETEDDLLAAEGFDPKSVDYTEWTGCPKPSDKPTLKCLFGTGPWWLDYFSPVTRIGHLYKNQNYWARKATKLQQCTQLPSIYVDGQCYKKIITGPTFVLTSYTFPTDAAPYPGHEKPAINPDLTNPICSWWTKAGEWAHIDSWEDTNKDGKLSPSDQIDVLLNWPSEGMSGIYDFHVDSVTVEGETVTITISLAEHIPKVTRKYLDVVVTNVNTKENCIFNWEVIMDDTELIGSGGPIELEELATTLFKVKFATPKAIPPCVHTFTIRVTTATGTNVYTIKAAVTFCDMNCDSKVDVKDLVLLIKAYGSYPGHIRWNANGDFNGDGKVDVKDLVNLIGMYGKFCGS